MRNDKRLGKQPSQASEQCLTDSDKSIDMVHGDGMTDDAIAGHEPVRGDSSLLRVVFVSGRSLELKVSDWTKRGLKKGLPVDMGLMAQLVSDSYAARARSLALRAVRSRARTAHEVREFLKQKQVSEEHSDDAVDELIRLGLLDDSKYAQDFIDSKRSKMSTRELRWHLSRRGVPGEIIERALSLEGPDEEYHSALESLRKYWRTHASYEREVRYRRAAQWMKRKGYPVSVVMRALESVTSGEIAEDLRMSDIDEGGLE